MPHHYDTGAQVTTPGHRYDGCGDCKAANRVRSSHYYQSHKVEANVTARDWARQNPLKRLAIRRRSNQKIATEKLEFIREIVGSICVDCGEDRVEALEYHHPAGRNGQKSVLYRSWTAIKEEVMHIIALCGTCHNLRHRALEVA